jgi:hypothetical protein
LRWHLLGRVPNDLLWGWAGPLLVTAFAALLRFWQLGRPHQLVFDETYYVKQAYTLLRDGYENQWPKEADKQFTLGNPDVYLPAADRAVHPPVGKWMIATGEWLFGIDSSTGWRFASAVCGTLMVFILAHGACSGPPCSGAPPGCCWPSTATTSCTAVPDSSTSSCRSGCSAPSPCSFSTATTLADGSSRGSATARPTPAGWDPAPGWGGARPDWAQRSVWEWPAG